MLRYVLIEVMRICHYWSTVLQGSIVSVQGPPWLCFEPLQLRNFDFDSDTYPDPAVHCNADPDQASKNNADPNLQPCPLKLFDVSFLCTFSMTPESGSRATLMNVDPKCGSKNPLQTDENRTALNRNRASSPISAYVQRGTGTSHIMEEDNGVKMEVWRITGG